MVLRVVKILAIILLIFVLVQIGYKYLQSKLYDPFREEHGNELSNYNDLNDWCLKSEYWFEEDSCGGYRSTNSSLTILLNKNGNYKGSCYASSDEGLDNECPYQSCFISSERSKPVDVCLSNKSYEYCENIIIKSKREDCFRKLFQNNRDKSLCYKISNEKQQRDNCLMEYAVQNRDSSICGEVADINIRKVCSYEFVTGSASCKKLFTDDKELNDCYDKYYGEFHKSNNEIFEAALLNDDVSQCKNILGTNFREYCILKFAIKDNRPDYCEGITDRQWVDECKKAFPKPL